MILNDQRQLGKIRRGNIHAFEQLFHSYYQGMYAYALSLLHKPEICEEVVQDVFYNIWKNREAIRITKSWQSYLFRAVYNNSMMYLRKQQRERPLEEKLLQGTRDSEDPHLILQYEEAEDLVSDVLEKLPERCRQIYLMNRRDGLKYKEIAQQLDISVKTVEANMGKALKALRKVLEKYGQV
jgi:RNA polymerase sigma-70 factor (ECF subfamily)